MCKANAFIFFPNKRAFECNVSSPLFFFTKHSLLLPCLLYFYFCNKINNNKNRDTQKKKKRKRKRKRKAKMVYFFFFTSFVLRTFCYCYYYSRLSLTIKSRHFEAASTLSKKKSAFFPLTAGVFFFFLPHAFSEAPCGAVTVPLISLFPC